MGTSLTQAYAVKLHRALIARNLPTFFDQLSIFLANVSYEITLKHEKYYQSLIFVICKMLGITAEAEVSTNKGRIDAVISTDHVVYIIEFKLNGTKEQALKQIKDTQYYQKYQGASKEICIIGVKFDQQERNIGGWVDERI
jgi:ATP-dependent exoDNAse (exonuclease V) beta subunit